MTNSLKKWVVVCLRHPLSVSPMLWVHVFPRFFRKSNVTIVIQLLKFNLADSDTQVDVFGFPFAINMMLNLSNVLQRYNREQPPLVAPQKVACFPRLFTSILITWPKTTEEKHKQQV